MITTSSIVIIPIKYKDYKNIRNWCKKNDKNAIITRADRPSEYPYFGSTDIYAFYQIAFSKFEIKILFQFSFQFDDRELNFYKKY